MKMDIVIKDVTPEQAALLGKMLESEALTLGSTVTITRPQQTEHDRNAALKEYAEKNQGGPVNCANEAPATVAPQNAPSDLDAAGFPWNEKIHSGNQQKTAKGVWTRRRGVEDATVAQVEGELRAAGFGQPSIADKLSRVETSLGIQPPVQHAPSYAPPVATAQPAYVAPAAAHAYAPAPQQYIPPQAPVQVAPVAPVTQDFSGLMTKISQLFSTQQITPDYLKSVQDRISAGFGGIVINAITDISGNPAMIDYAFQILKVDGKA